MNQVFRSRLPSTAVRALPNAGTNLLAHLVGMAGEVDKLDGRTYSNGVKTRFAFRFDA